MNWEGYTHLKKADYKRICDFYVKLMADFDAYTEVKKAAKKKPAKKAAVKKVIAKKTTKKIAPKPAKVAVKGAKTAAKKKPTTWPGPKNASKSWGVTPAT